MIDDETRRDFSRNGNLRIAKRNSGIWWSLGLLSLAGGGYLIVSLPGILVAIGMLIYAEAHLRRILSGYATYYNQVRTTTWHYRKMRPCIDQSGDPAPSLPLQSWLGCTINMSGCDIRKGQASPP